MARNKSQRRSGLIEIEIENPVDNPTQLIIQIRDDGVGRKAALKRKEENAHKSYGIDITKERLEIYGIDNRLFISDLYDEFERPLGTLVILKINLQND